MLSQSIFAVAMAGVATALTGPGFQPAAKGDLFVAFGTEKAMDAVVIPKADTASPPTIGTTERLFGTYTIMMVDPDIPASTAGGPTGELLHWLQPGLVPATTSTKIAGTDVFLLTNPSNVSAFAAYIQPQPPAVNPISHNYNLLLLNTTGNSTAMSSLMTAGMTRMPFDAVSVLTTAGVTPLFGNSFNVTNTTGLTQPSANATGTGAGNGTSTPVPVSTSGAVAHGLGAGMVGLGALVAALFML